jgi:hypothetical protein
MCRLVVDALALIHPTFLSTPPSGSVLMAKGGVDNGLHGKSCQKSSSRGDLTHHEGGYAAKKRMFSRNGRKDRSRVDKRQRIHHNSPQWWMRCRLSTLLSTFSILLSLSTFYILIPPTF